jgi:hypothetical protein
MPSPTNYAVSFEDGGMTITAYYDPDSSNVAKGPVIFLDSGNSTLNAAPFVYVDLVASGTCPGCPPPCYLPCCYTPGGPCMPSDPIDVVFKLEIK